MIARCVSVAVLLALSGTQVVAQSAEGSAIEYGFEQRVRNEQWDNIMDFNAATPDARNQIRWRTRAWVKIPTGDNVTFAVGGAQETNQIIEPRKPWRMDEGFVETAYIDVKRLFRKGWSLRAGRQNLTFGEGFLVLEGNAWDGSRSIYFNAIDLAYTRGKSRLDLLAISNPRTDRYLPQIHDRNRTLTEWDEQAAGAYLTTAAVPNTTLEFYYFLKRENHDPRSPGNPQYEPDKQIHTLGGRAVRTFAGNWSATGEAAAQWGRKLPGTPIQAQAGYAYVKKTFGAAKRVYALGGYWGFSGDHPGTPQEEGWDPLFSRFPKWSELVIYSQLQERGIAYWTNLGAWGAEAGYAPWKPLRCRVTLYDMNAFAPYAGSPKVFGAGTHRGLNFQTRADLTVNRTWSGHVLYERFRPGDFYQGPSSGHFLRFEVIFQIRGRHPLAS